MKIPIWFNNMTSRELLILSKECIKHYNSVGSKQYEVKEIKQ